MLRVRRLFLALSALALVAWLDVHPGDECARPPRGERARQRVAALRAQGWLPERGREELARSPSRERLDAALLGLQEWAQGRFGREWESGVAAPRTWDAEHAQELARVLEERGELFDRLEELVDSEDARRVLESREAATRGVGSLLVTRHWTNLSCARAVHESRDPRTAARAPRSLATALELASLDAPAGSIGVAVRRANLGIALQGLRAVLTSPHAPAAALRAELEAPLARFDDPEALERALREDLFHDAPAALADTPKEAAAPDGLADYLAAVEASIEIASADDGALLDALSAGPPRRELAGVGAWRSLVVCQRDARDLSRLARVALAAAELQQTTGSLPASAGEIEEGLGIVLPVDRFDGLPYTLRRSEGALAIGPCRFAAARGLSDARLQASGVLWVLAER